MINTPPTKQHIWSTLRRGKWFGSLSEDLQERIIDGSVIRSYEDREIISAEDRPARGLHAILQGQVSIGRRIGENRDFLFHIGGPGFWCGELAVLGQSLTVVTFTARTNTTTLFLPKAEFLRIARDEPAVYEAFAQMVSQRMAVTLRNLAQSLALPPEEYLRIRLADLVANWQLDGTDDDVIEIALSQTDLANMIGVARQTVNRLLQKLESLGWIETSFRSIRILEPELLRGTSRNTGFDEASMT